MKAYLFWYKSNELEHTEYIYVIAYTLKQALYFWRNYVKNVLGNVYDYEQLPVDIIREEDFVKKHNVGDILGEYAII